MNIGIKSMVMSPLLIAVSIASAASDQPASESKLPTFSQAENLLSPAPQLVSGPQFPGILGQALVDFDNDGDLDIFVTNSEGHANYLYLNDGNGHFIDVAREAGVQFSSSYSVSVGVGDFDNDGLQDILIGRQTNSNGDPAHPLLLKNAGLNRHQVPVFKDISVETGLARVAKDVRTLGFAVADYDNDGRLDVYLGAFDLQHSGDAMLPIGTSDPNILLMNKSGKRGLPHFEDVTDRAGVAGVKVFGRTADTENQSWYPHTWAVYSSDVDGNGLMDIVAMNEVPGIVEVHLNQGNARFELMDNSDLSKAGGWMGITSADFNADGNLDYFITNLGAELTKFGLPGEINVGSAVSPGGTPYHVLLNGTAAGGLTDVAATTIVEEGVHLPSASLNLAPGLQAYDFGWGATSFDANNDGYKDLYWVGAHWVGMPLNGVGRFLLNNQGKSFSDVTGVAGLFNIPKNQALDFANGHNGYSVLSGDIDGDGDDDLVVVNGSDSAASNAPAGVRIFKNEIGNSKPSVTISLSSKGGNVYGIGARVSLYSVDVSTVSEAYDMLPNERELGEFIFAYHTSHQVEEIVSTTSAFSATQPVAKFGLGSEKYSLVKVSWPDGSVSNRILYPYTSSTNVKIRH